MENRVFKPMVYKKYAKVTTKTYVLGKLIAYYRIKAGLTHWQLSLRLNCAQTTCNKMENDTKISLLWSKRLQAFEEVVGLSEGSIKKTLEDIYSHNTLPFKLDNVQLVEFITNFIEKRGKQNTKD